jgi:hypothetical protein
MHVKPKRETIIEDGWYPAEIGQVEERETKFGEKLLVPFEVDAGGDTIAIDAWLSVSDHPKSNLVKWAKNSSGTASSTQRSLRGSAARCLSRRARTRKAPPRTSSASSGLR